MKCFLVNAFSMQYAIKIYEKTYSPCPNFIAFIPFSWEWEEIVNNVVTINNWHPSKLRDVIIMLYKEEGACSKWRRKLVGIYEDYLTCKTKPFAINPGPDYCAIDLTEGQEPKGILFHD